MTPGLALGPPFPAKATKGAIVAIASDESPSVPLVVGTCEFDIANLETVRGSKGHAVKGLHWYGDEIWNWSQNDRPGTDPPDRLEGWYEEHDIENNEIRAAQHGMEDLNVKDSEDDQDVGGGVPVNGLEGGKVEGEYVATLGETSIEKKEWTTKGLTRSFTYSASTNTTLEIDQAFRNAFLYAMHNARETRKDEANHGIEFPIQQSSFMSNYILPYLPVFSSDDSAALQLKKTSWKGVKKFIKALDKEVLVKSKERNGGETVILDVDFEDQAIANFTPFKLPKKETSPTTGTGNAGESPSATDDSIGQTLKRLQLLKPKEKIAPLFGPSNADPKALYLPTELRPIITTYIESESLISPTNKRLVTIDPILANAVFDSSSAIDKEAIAKGSVPRDLLIERISATCCSPHYIILRNNETRNDVKPKSGGPPNVKITLETRTGNKKATKVSGLEIYGVRPVALADELQKACASSTSVNQLVGSSPKNPVLEIMVQGPQKDAILKALEKRGVRKEWVEVLDKTKKKK